jgi:hypothetical protein
LLTLHSILSSLTIGIAEEDDVLEGEQPARVMNEEKDEDFDEEEYDDVELAELPPNSTPPKSPSGRNELKQFDDVDLAAPQDFNLVPSHRVLL